MPAIPTLRGTSKQVLYGSSRTVSCLTKINVFNNGSEQRWVRRVPLYDFTIPMKLLTGADKAAWLSFFSNSSVLGRYGNTLSLTLNSTTYSNLGLDSDDLVVVTQNPLLYDQQVVVRQLQAANSTSYTPPTVGSSYPTLKFGYSSASVSAEYPFTQTSSYYTSVTNNLYGSRFSFPWYNGSLSGFPTSYLRSWKLVYPLLTDADATTLETYFLGQQGRYGSFTFTDPIDSTAYTHVRFDSDDLTFKYLTLGQQATEITLRQTNGS